jgi:hypothetical protein
MIMILNLLDLKPWHNIFMIMILNILDLKPWHNTFMITILNLLATKAIVVQDCQLLNSPPALDIGVVDCEE